MAATKKPSSGRSTTRKTSTRKPAAKRETIATQKAKKRMRAVVVFAVGVLILLLTCITGEKLWLAVHNFLYGLFSWSVWFIGPVLIYIAVIAEMDKPLSSIKAKLWQATLLIILISSTIQIFSIGVPEADSMVQILQKLYSDGVGMKGGGLVSALIALPLLTLTGPTGAKIIVLLGLFVFAMLVTGSTLVGLFKTLSKPVKEIENAYVARVEEKQQIQHTQPTAPKKGAAKRPLSSTAAADAGTSPRFNIDVDISQDEPLPPELPTTVSPPVDAAAMPSHPVIAGKAPLTVPQESDSVEIPEDVLAKFDREQPVEYINPEEFMPEPVALTADPLPNTEEDVPVRPHPLEEDIRLAEEADSKEDIADIVDRYINSTLEPDLGQPFQAVIPAPNPDFSMSLEPDPSTTQLPPWEMEGEAVTAIDGSIDVPTEKVQQAPPPAPAAGISAPPPAPIYRKPPVTLLKASRSKGNEDVSEELKGNAQRLVDTLKSFGVQTRITDICRGPAVTRYELQPSAGVKISKITNLSDDIALNLAASGIRIEAPIPNKPAVGIEVPNKKVDMVTIREIIDSREFQKADSSVSVALGKDIAGNIMLADIGKMPHMLIAGATGSGKSVCINSIICSLLFKASPDEVKLLMVDPKVVELGIYNGIPHLLVPVVTDPKKAAGALGWAVNEMLKRYKTFAENSVRDLNGYNRLAEGREDLQPMPKIVIIIDELADLMMAAPNEVEDSICRLAQMARAAGMHLIIATQRPSVDVITGVIKANIPSRIAFAVSSQVDSRTILDMGGAEKLLGRGDMLFYPVGAAKPQRVQGCFVTDAEVEQVVSYVKEDESGNYDEAIAEEIEKHVVADKSGGKDSGGGFNDEDEMLPQAIECVVEAGQASTSLLQRRLKLGYARAARIVDQLEEKGIIGPFEGSKPRQVLISKDRWIEMKLSGAEAGQLKLQEISVPSGAADREAVFAEPPREAL